MMSMDPKSHWENVYRTKAPAQTSWYSPHLETSLAMIRRAAGSPSPSIIDVGGGQSSLVDDLLAAGYGSITVLDIAQTALNHVRLRLGTAAQSVQWLVGDVTQMTLPPRCYDVWHDRAVFHFLTQPAQQAAYVRQVLSAVKPGGRIILAVFGPQGPEKCSGLDVVRNDPTSLHEQLGERFRLLESSLELHQTPFGTVQQFLYCSFVLE
jgi:2-polyprenyl-3-methyl-5-hydroxy-6-metoxy-1,4-benzoquinol methylase